VIKAGLVDEIGVSFVFYGDEIYHYKPVFRHVFEGHARPGNVEGRAHVFGAEPHLAVFVGSGTNIRSKNWNGLARVFNRCSMSHLLDQGRLRQNRAQDADGALVPDLKQADLDFVACRRYG
jgi:hypothetical protein